MPDPALPDPVTSPIMPADAGLAGGDPALPFGATLVQGRFGSATAAAGVFVMPLLVGAVETVTARRGRLAELLALLTERMGFAIQDRPAVWTTPRRRVIGIAPGRFQVFGFDPAEASVFDPVACRVRQTGAIAMLRLAGPHLPEVLAKGMSIDLHPAVFRPASVAVTTLDHLPVTIIRLADVAGHAVYDLMTGRSYARDLGRWLTEAGAVYGVEIHKLETDLSSGTGFFDSHRTRA